MSACLLHFPEVCRRTTLSETEIRRRMKEGTFPQNVSIGEKRIAWLESEISAWIDARVQESREPKPSSTEG